MIGYYRFPSMTRGAPRRRLVCSGDVVSLNEAGLAISLAAQKILWYMIAQ